MIQFQQIDVRFTLKRKLLLKQWIREVVALHRKKAGDLSIVFCSDEHLLQINRQYLQHDYYTDIITFDYSTGEFVSGDLLISIDRVKDNALQQEIPFEDELHRIIIHGILHLIGFKDKTKAQQEEMRREENKALRSLKAKG